MNKIDHFIEVDAVVFARAFNDPNKYFLFRSTHSQVEIKIIGAVVYASSILTSEEIQLLKYNLPLVNIDSYTVFRKTYDN